MKRVWCRPQTVVQKLRPMSMWRHAGTVELSINLHVMPAAESPVLYILKQMEDPASDRMGWRSIFKRLPCLRDTA